MKKDLFGFKKHLEFKVIFVLKTQDQNVRNLMQLVPTYLFCLSC